MEGLLEAEATVVSASRAFNTTRQVVAEFKNKGYDAHALQVDQSDHTAVLKLKEEINAKFGRLDVFFNNAVARPMRTYTSPIEDFAESMRVNAVGMFDIVREMADLIARSGGGSIISISSMMGMFGPDLSNYDGTTMGTPPADYFFHKGGMIALTRYLARVLADKKIRVNCISPGGLLEDDPERFIQNYSRKVPVGRMAFPEDIKGLAVFLASDASAYINGENILMDGGMHS
jgi:NAD(P)-dependent dehydrogenase (short-subunit alcohol dehydrogenase family)